jgi:hypothetical protein
MVAGSRKSIAIGSSVVERSSKQQNTYVSVCERDLTSCLTGALRHTSRQRNPIAKLPTFTVVLRHPTSSVCIVASKTRLWKSHVKEGMLFYEQSDLAQSCCKLWTSAITDWTAVITFNIFSHSKVWLTSAEALCLYHGKRRHPLSATQALR